MAVRKRKRKVSKRRKRAKKFKMPQMKLLKPVLWAAIYILSMCLISEMHSHTYRMSANANDMMYRSVLIQSYVLKQCKKLSEPRGI